MLRLIGGLFLLYTMASQAANSLLSAIDYDFKPINRSDFRIGIDQGRVVGKLRLHLIVKNKGSVSLTAERLSLQISQQGTLLGTVITTNPISLPAQSEKDLSFDLQIPAGQFLNRLEAIFNGSISQAIAPLHIKGNLTLNGGQVIPINRQVKFFAVS